MKYKIVSTLGPNGWETYGKRFADSVAKHWPDSRLEIWCHDVHPLPTHHFATFHNLDNVPAFNTLKGVLRGNDGPSLQYSFKAIALVQACDEDLEWIAFIDADTEFFFDVDEAFLKEVFDDEYHLTYLKRNFGESEGSWFAFNVKNPFGASLLTDYWGIYTSLEFLHYRKQHDNAMLDRLVAIHGAHGLRAKNLCEGSLGADGFHQSILGAYACHYKGPKKDTIADPKILAPERYGLLDQIVRHVVRCVGPTVRLAETGTWNGSRAVQMALAAAEAGASHVAYWGYDLFEANTIGDKEFHTKPNARFEHVKRRLEIFRQVMERKGVTFDFELVRGDTNVTLKNPPTVDFVFIDGGHSVETVENDYRAFQTAPFVVFDDILKNEEEGVANGPRIVFERIKDDDRKRKNLIVTPDGYVGTAQPICLGIVIDTKFPAPALQLPLELAITDSVERSEQMAYVVENTRRMSQWLQVCQAHQREALLVSAGPTLPRFLTEIKMRQREGAVVFAVKHAVPILQKAEIVPDFVVLLDARKVEESSTHGVKRRDLIEAIDARSNVLLATMSNPHVLTALQERNVPVWGWHAYTAAFAQMRPEETKRVGLVINGGTCAATRLPMLAFTLGFRRMTFYGYDFYYEEGTDQTKLSQKLLPIQMEPGFPTRLTTGELIAARNDLVHWFSWMLQQKLTIEFRGDGEGKLAWDKYAANYEAPKEFSALFGTVGNG